MNETVFESVFSGMRYCFYVLHPSETYYETFQEVPNYVAKAFPAMLLLVFIEIIVKFLTGKLDGWRLHVAVINISCGGLTEACQHFMMRGAELTVYTWVYENYRLFTLPWDSPYTYFFSILGVDFGYYWWHRASHETSLMWAGHYVHHSSEDFNMTTALRASITVRPLKWMWFMHMAFLGLPPVTFIIHMQLALLFGAWVHYECIPKLSKVIPVIGHVIEFVMSTPSHHRVHHGANPYCLDKNYAQVLIIWDRMFGTFVEEKEDEEITYGTIENKKTQHILYVQVYPLVDLWRKVQSMKTFENKFKALFYGPAWQPGKPRLGDERDIPDVRGRKKNQLHLPTWLSIYVAWHAALVLYSYIEMMGRIKTLGNWVPEMNLTYILLSLTSLGGVYDAHRYTIVLEPLRLLCYLFLLKFYPIVGKVNVASFLALNHCVSLLLCPILAYVLLKRIRDEENQEKETAKSLSNDASQIIEDGFVHSKKGKVKAH